MARYTAVHAPDGTRDLRRRHRRRRLLQLCRGEPYAHPGYARHGGGAAQTNLAIRAANLPAAAGQASTTVYLDCRASAADSDVTAFCRDVELDRYALLQPLVAGPTCAGGPAAAAEISITGIFAGRSIERSYGGCEFVAGQRWVALLRRHGVIPATGA